MQYLVYGPFNVPASGRQISSDGLKEFWQEVEYYVPGLSRAIGVYVFSTCHGVSYTPWYVGKTNSVKGFRGEIFQTHKLNHYISAREQKRGRSQIHFIARVVRNKTVFARKSQLAEKEIDALETALIAMALRANDNLKNSKKTRFMRECRVPGLMGRPDLGRKPEAVNTLMAAFNL